MILESETPLISQSLLEDLTRLSRKYGHLKRWTPQAYFELDGNYFVEFIRGKIEVLPMPNVRHQLIAAALFAKLNEFVQRSSSGTVLFAGTRVKVSDDIFREPDVLFVPKTSLAASHDDYVEGAALVIEVVSESNRDHDLTTKRGEYARAQIPEYWIVNPEESNVTVLMLADDEYVVHGVFSTSDHATSVVLKGLAIPVAELFDRT